VIVCDSNAEISVPRGTEKEALSNETSKGKSPFSAQRE
jgi:hypothetical protein